MTPVLPFTTARDNAIRKLAQAHDSAALNLCAANGAGILYGYYLAGAVAPIVYQAARDTLAAEAAHHRSILLLREELEVAQTESPRA